MLSKDRHINRHSNGLPEGDEPLGLMEPLLPPEAHSELGDLVVDLVAKSQRLAGMLHPRVQAAIGDLVRSMNCYYSNLIEGHDTHPRDIDRALAKDYAKEPRKRSLQQEAVAHIQVQQMIDGGADLQIDPTSREYVLWLHRSFCERLPKDLLWVESPDGRKRIEVVPGVLRDGRVTVGRHEPPGPGNLDRFLARFEEAYAPGRLSKSMRIIAAGAAHHRLLWIHPFYDGNGRVTRLMSHAMLLRLGIGSPLWSVARGLARNVEDYKRLLENADERRQSDLDGRGTLSEKALVDFCRYFLKVCIDQVDYMTTLLQPTEFLNRIGVYFAEEIAAKRAAKGSFPLMREAVLAGEFERGRAPAITGYGERQARNVLSDLVRRGFLRSDSPKLPVRLGFPIEVVERWFPALYPGTSAR
jgi:Fic family protein